MGFHLSRLFDDLVFNFGQNKLKCITRNPQTLFKCCTVPVTITLSPPVVVPELIATSLLSWFFAQQDSGQSSCLGDFLLEV